MCFLLVMTIFMQFRIVQKTEETNMDMMRETELRQELANWKNKYDETKAKYDETLETLASYKEESTAESKTRETLENELFTLEEALGRTDVEGEGVIITLSQKTPEELGELEDVWPITAQDLTYIVNYLKDAGAEAISINGERIVSTTYIVDVGELGKNIKINSKYLRDNTYTIKAIGNSTYLESSIFGKGGYAEQFNTSGIKATSEKSNKVYISAYSGEFETKYMEEAQEQ